MSQFSKGYDINKTFIIEPLFVSGDTPVTSACTIFYTNNIRSCSGTTNIFLGETLLLSGDTFIDGLLFGDVFSGNTFFSGGTELSEIINENSITGGTFVNDVLTLTKFNDETVVITGFNGSNFYTTGATLIDKVIYFNRNDSLSAYTVDLSTFSASSVFVSGVTFDLGVLTLNRNDGVNLSVEIDNFNSLSASTFFSGGTDLSEIINENSITGGTFSNNDLILNKLNGGSVVITGFSDFYLTGITFENNNLTLFDNNNQSFSVLINNLTGLTINGVTNLNGEINSNNLSGSTSRFVEVDSGGTFTATKEIINAYISSGSTVANLLEDNLNWDINGVYTGSTITGTFQGQKYYDLKYFYEAIDDNIFIRLIRG